MRRVLQWREAGPTCRDSTDGRFMITVYGPGFPPYGFMATAHRRPVEGARLTTILGDYSGRERDDVTARAIQRCQQVADLITDGTIL